MNNPTLINWIKDCSQKAELILSVCTGALLLAKAGLLERFVDNGKIILSAGISAGIDMSLHVVVKLLGKEQALQTAQYIEYNWKPEL